MWKTALLATALMLLTYSVASLPAQTREDRCAEYPKGGVCPAIRVSMINLIGTPERYHGKMVETTGYLFLEFEHQALYFARDSTRDEGIWVQVGDEAKAETDADWQRWGKLFDTWQCKFNGQRVVVRGVFDMRPIGHMAPTHPGSIAIKEIRLLQGEEKPCTEFTRPNQEK